MLRIDSLPFALSVLAACAAPSVARRSARAEQRSPRVAAVSPPAQGVARVAAMHAGNLDQCALMTDGTVRCWGRNGDGRLGDGTESDRDEPTAVVDASGIVQLAVGASAGWGVRSDGTVLFWGNDNLAWAIDPEMRLRHSHRATRVRGLADIASIAAGDESACAISRRGTLACLGYNQFGQLGAGVFTPIAGASVVTGLPPVRAVAIGLSHACAVDEAGRVWCWGANDHGQLGSRPSAPVARPALVEGVDDVVQIAAGRNETCVLNGRGAVTCWGENLAGEIGIGHTSEWEPPSRIDLAPAVAIAVGGQHACAIARNRVAWCWGDNGFAQLATNILGGPHPAPVRVDYARDVVSMSAAGDNTCVTTAQDEIACVGAPTIGVQRYSLRLERQTSQRSGESIH